MMFIEVTLPSGEKYHVMVNAVVAFSDEENSRIVTTAPAPFMLDRGGLLRPPAIASNSWEILTTNTGKEIAEMIRKAMG